MQFESTPEFDAQFIKLTRKNKALKERLIKKIGQILDNPFTGAPKRYALKHARGSHIDPYVIVYRILEDAVQFLYVDHHDLAYEKAAEILNKLEKLDSHQ